MLSSVDGFHTFLKSLCFLWLIWLQISYMIEARKVAKLKKEGAKLGPDSPLLIALRARDSIGGLRIMPIIFLTIFILGEAYLT